MLIAIAIQGTDGCSALRAAETNALIRVNQVGSWVGDTKQAILLATGSESGAKFDVVGSDGAVALASTVGRSVGSWNRNYSSVYVLDFSGVRNSGVFFIKVEGRLPAASQSFRIGTRREIYLPLLRNSLFFFQAQRDGPNVLPTTLNRRPSHLTDKRAFVYKVPAFGDNGFRGDLEKIGGPIDVSGGWFDAGDYLKFVETASYVTAIMLHGVRDYPLEMRHGGSADFTAEARYGLDWLLKMWDDRTKTLYVQVGIGDGNEQIRGDHDVLEASRSGRSAQRISRFSGIFRQVSARVCGRASWGSN